MGEEDIRGKLTTISLSKREVARIKDIMVASGMKQHQVIKLAVRSFLFPEEDKTAQTNTNNNKESEASEPSSPNSDPFA